MTWKITFLKITFLKIHTLEDDVYYYIQGGTMFHPPHLPRDWTYHHRGHHVAAVIGHAGQECSNYLVGIEEEDIKPNVEPNATKNANVEPTVEPCVDPHVEPNVEKNANVEPNVEPNVEKNVDAK